MHCLIVNGELHTENYIHMVCVYLTARLSGCSMHAQLLPKVLGYK